MLNVLAGRRAAACALAGAWAIATLVRGVAAQQPSAPTFRGGVDVINLDVSVLDKDRRPVRGLTAADFTVLENGRPRPIVAFSPVELPAPAPATAGSAPWLRNIPSDVSTNEVAPDGRLLAIVFDHSIRFEDLGRARRVAVAAIEELGPNDVAGITFTDGFANTGTVQGFTSDKARLLEAVSRPISAAAAEVVRMSEAAPSALDETSSCYCNVCAFEKVGDVAEAVANVTGRRKTMLFIGFSTPDPNPGSGTCGEAIRKARDGMTGKLARANLTVHVVDPSGGWPLHIGLDRPGGYGDPRDSRGSLPDRSFWRHQILMFLAELTGGRHVFEDNNPEREVPIIFNETSAYYLLAIPVSEASTANNRPSRLEVKVRGRNLTVQARSGYQANQTKAAVDAAARNAPLVESIGAALPRSDQRLTIAAASFATPGQPKATVAVVVRAEPSAAAASSPTPATPRRDVISGVLIAFDPEGRVVASKKHAGEVPWAPGSSMPGPYELVTALELAPGRYEIRAGLDAAPDRRSSVYGFVEVPPFGDEPLTLSDIAVAVQPAEVSAPKGALDGILPVVPTARRVFTRRDQVIALVRIYHDRPDPPATSLDVRIVDATGRSVVTTRVADATDEYLVPVRVDELTPGEYLLELSAESGTHRATRQLRFRVE